MESENTEATPRGNLIQGKLEHTIHMNIAGPFRIRSDGGAK